MSRRRSVLKDVFLMLREHRSYWLAPALVALLLLGALVLVGSTSAGPFIYTVF